MKHRYINRLKFLKTTVAVCALAAILGCMEPKSSNVSTRPNVLFIAVDDLNDWIGCLDGHPQAKTPNIDRLAANGVLFEQAYCAAPLCNPSRTSIMTGLRPSTTGIYSNWGLFREHPDFADWVTIPQYFRQHGYMAWTGGKIYHQPKGKYSDSVAWDHQYQTKVGTPYPPADKQYQHGLKGKFPTTWFNDGFDWAPIEETDEQTEDWKTADLAAQFLQEPHDKPFFLGCGIFRPHLRWYAPKKYFDMHPLEDIQLPAHIENDLDDVPALGIRLARKDFPIVKENGKWKEAVQAYLACTSFADACVGRVLDALEKSPHRDNTIVVLWGDHGYHVGTKEHFSKVTLWEEANRTPVIVLAPGTTKAGGRCSSPVSLVDLYPTLLDLCGLPERDDLDGRSFLPLIKNPEKEWPYPAVMTHWKNNHAVKDQRYRYISYRDGTEELYDHDNDQNEWTNLADDPKYDDVKKRLAEWLPKTNAEHFQPEPPENM